MPKTQPASDFEKIFQRKIKHLKTLTNESKRDDCYLSIEKKRDDSQYHYMALRSTMGKVLLSARFDKSQADLKTIDSGKKVNYKVQMKVQLLNESTQRFEVEETINIKFVSEADL